MNEPLGDREVLCVSQFTLYGDARKGNRPSFVAAAPAGPGRAAVRALCRPSSGAQGGVFGARMAVELGERRAGDAAARRPIGHSAAPCRPRIASSPASPPSPRRSSCPTAAGPTRLREEFLAACLRVDTEGEELGEPGDIVWYPDRTWDGRTYVPATARDTAGLELFGYVSFVARRRGRASPSDFEATRRLHRGDRRGATRTGSSTSATRSSGIWRGEEGREAAMTLVWGTPLVSTRGAIVTAELADLAVDQCMLIEDRFTLLAPDDYRDDTLEVKLWTAAASEVAPRVALRGRRRGRRGRGRE